MRKERRKEISKILRDPLYGGAVAWFRNLQNRHHTRLPSLHHFRSPETTFPKRVSHDRCGYEVRVIHVYTPHKKGSPDQDEALYVSTVFSSEGTVFPKKILVLPL